MTRKRTWLFLSTLALFAGAAAGDALAAGPPVTQVPSPPMCRSQWGTPIPCPPSSTPATGTAPIPQPTVAQHHSASLNVNPPIYSGTCPTTITFNGTITAPGAGRVQYKFVRSDGALSPVQTLEFTAPGAKPVNHTWWTDGPSGWEAIQIVYPVSLTSNRAEFTLRCAATGGTQTQPPPLVSSRPLLLPDLHVAELRVNERCKIVATVENLGPGPLPDAAWISSKLAIGYASTPQAIGANLFAIPMATVDPGHQLRNPGGRATYVSYLTVPAGGAPAYATVDGTNAVAEADERNNSRAGVLTCAAASVTPPPSPGTATTSPGAAPPTASGPLPDLIIRDLRLNERCEIVANVSNLGPGRVPDAVWTVHAPNSSSVHLTIDGRPWGGETIWKFDPRRALQAPHGHTIYVSNYVVHGSATVQATVDHTAQVAEVNEGNNARTETLSCRGAAGAGGLPDLIPVLREPMDGSVGVRNIGTGRSGPTKLTLDCRKEGHTGGGGGCPDSPGLAAFQDPTFPDVVTVNIPALGPGRAHIMRLPFWPSLRFTSGRYIFTATADAASTERESDERNNVRRTSLTVR